MRHLFLLPALTLSLCATLSAGPLTPPAGPVAPTPGPEARVAIDATNTPGDADSLFKITAPGSYYLTANITGAAGKSGIEIATSSVTIDLNGFDLSGVPGALDGVRTTAAALANISVFDGTVRSWPGNGIDLFSFSSLNTRLESLLCHNNGGAGITVGDTASVINCASNNNAGDGIAVATSSLVSNCVAYSNSGAGISASSSCAVFGCIARVNTLDGILGLSSSQFRDNTCTFNGSTGGTGAGIRVTGPDNRIEGNNCIGADFGIKVDSTGNFISRNTCSGNTTNWDIVAGNRCLVVNSAAAGAITGNSGGVSPGSTDPNANYTY